MFSDSGISTKKDNIEYSPSNEISSFQNALWYTFDRKKGSSQVKKSKSSENPTKRWGHSPDT